jgi:multidrug resistance efflux pump
MAVFDHQIALATKNVGFAKEGLATALALNAKKALARDVVVDWQKQLEEANTELAKHNAQKRERSVVGVLEAETELYRREKDLADAEAAHRILEFGARPEEIEAEEARLARIQEEQYFLEKTREKLRITSPLAGVITTPYMRDRVGQYFREGELICEVENLHGMEIEIPLDEQDINHVVPGLAVDLKPRSLPLHTLTATVKSITPYAVPGKVQSMVVVNCELEESADELLPGMTGYARVYCGTCTPASYVWSRFVRYLRTEVWW